MFCCNLYNFWKFVLSLGLGKLISFMNVMGMIVWCVMGTIGSKEVLLVILIDIACWSVKVDMKQSCCLPCLHSDTGAQVLYDDTSLKIACTRKYSSIQGLLHLVWIQMTHICMFKAVHCIRIPVLGSMGESLCVYQRIHSGESIAVVTVSVSISTIALCFPTAWTYPWSKRAWMHLHPKSMGATSNGPLLVPDHTCRKQRNIYFKWMGKTIDYCRLFQCGWCVVLLDSTMCVSDLVHWFWRIHCAAVVLSGWLGWHGFPPRGNDSCPSLYGELILILNWASSRSRMTTYWKDGFWLFLVFWLHIGSILWLGLPFDSNNKML